jgi:ATP-dependent exoDNAse (exonuclease V) alpha subunit
MVATDDLAEIVGLAHRRHWRLVLVGDPAQLPALGRGGVFAHLCDTLPHHELETPRRFHQPWEAHASLALRAGDPTVADVYAARGRLSTAHPALVPDRVLDLLRRHQQAGQRVAITTTTAETARRINRTIQASLPSHGPAAVLADGSRVRAGDVVATRRNDQTIKTDQHQMVRNRQTWTAAVVTTSGDVYVEHTERGLAKLPSDYVRRHVELGWAVTGYGNQGDTVDVGIAVLEPATNRNHAYVAMTRGRHTNIGIVVDPASGDAATGFAAIVARSPAERSALATVRHLAEQAGLPDPAMRSGGRRAPLGR